MYVCIRKSNRDLLSRIFSLSVQRSNYYINVNLITAFLQLSLNLTKIRLFSLFEIAPIIGEKLFELYMFVPVPRSLNLLWHKTVVYSIFLMIYVQLS